MALRDFAQALGRATLSLDPAAFSQRLAAFAISERDRLIAAGDASPRFNRFVDGVAGAPETAVRADGVILYQFAILPEVAAFGLSALRQLSPIASGRYRDSHFITVDGAEIPGSDDIGLDVRQFIITNSQPYSRKIQVGSKGFTVYAGIYDKARTAMNALYGAVVEIDLIFIELQGGYVLRKSGSGRRKDRTAGRSLTYPALQVTRR